MGYRVGRRLVPSSTIQHRMRLKDARFEVEARRRAFAVHGPCGHQETRSTDGYVRECRAAAGHLGDHDYGMWWAR
jgi:hypothetical protein